MTVILWELNSAPVRSPGGTPRASSHSVVPVLALFLLAVMSVEGERLSGRLKPEVEVREPGR